MSPHAQAGKRLQRPKRACLPRSLPAELDRTPFTKRAFKVADSDGNAALDFRELMFTVWNFCTLDRNGLATFTFDVYDQDASGTMEKPELVKIIRDVYHLRDLNSKAMRHALSSLDGLPGQHMTKQQFAKYASAHSQLLQPAFEAQRLVRKAFGGEAYWRSALARRQKKKDAKYHPSRWMDMRAWLMSADIEVRQRAGAR